VLERGRPAPRFTLPAFPGGTAGLDDSVRGRTVLLHFYSRDFIDIDRGRIWTAALGLHALSSELERFEEARVSIFGISRSSLAHHETLAERLAIRFPLLSDESGAVGEKYGLLPHNRWAGSTDKYDINCKLFIVDGAGMVRQTYETGLVVSPDHPLPQDVQRSFEESRRRSWNRLDPLSTTALLEDLREPT
jgi:peroxiredoxin Q/BCP